jgi:hypothetical protein
MISSSFVLHYFFGASVLGSLPLSKKFSMAPYHVTASDRQAVALSHALADSGYTVLGHEGLFVAGEGRLKIGSFWAFTEADYALIDLRPEKYGFTELPPLKKFRDFVAQGKYGVYPACDDFLLFIKNLSPANNAPALARLDNLISRLNERENRLANPACRAWPVRR